MLEGTLTVLRSLMLRVPALRNEFALRHALLTLRPILFPPEARLSEIGKPLATTAASRTAGYMMVRWQQPWALPPYAILPRLSSS